MSDDGARHRGDVGDADALRRLGYAQDLLRRMGAFSSFAVSFSIISVLTGCISAYPDALATGGPAGLALGWPLVSAGTMLVALAMAELASSFPTAGALYHWSALLGGVGIGWMTATINIVGQVAIVAAIDFGCATELSATLGYDGRAPTFAILALVLGSQALINAFRVRLVAILNDLSATVHVIGVIAIVGALILVGRVQPVSFLATSFTTRPDGDRLLGFFNALILGMFTFTGYDASAHLSEETHDPARASARGIVSSVAVSAVAGYLLLVALTLGIRDLPAVAADGHAPLTILRGALGDGFGRAAMGLAVLAMWFCGLSSVTSTSRTLFAFARDGGLPRALAVVGVRTRTPLMAIGTAALIPFAIVLVVSPFGRAFDVMAKTATMALYVSYAMPIVCGLLARSRGVWTTRGPFHLGPFGVAIGWFAVGWSAFVLVVCALPPNQAPAAVLAVFVALLVLVWRGGMNKRFHGPKVTLTAASGGP